MAGAYGDPLGNAFPSSVSRSAKTAGNAAISVVWFATDQIKTTANQIKKPTDLIWNTMNQIKNATDLILKIVNQT